MTMLPMLQMNDAVHVVESRVLRVCTVYSMMTVPIPEHFCEHGRRRLESGVRTRKRTPPSPKTTQTHMHSTYV